MNNNFARSRSANLTKYGVERSIWKARLAWSNEHLRFEIELNGYQKILFQWPMVVRSHTRWSDFYIWHWSEDQFLYSKISQTWKRLGRTLTSNLYHKRVGKMLQNFLTRSCGTRSLQKKLLALVQRAMQIRVIQRIPRWNSVFHNYNGGRCIYL